MAIQASIWYLSKYPRMLTMMHATVDGVLERNGDCPRACIACRFLHTRAGLNVRPVQQSRGAPRPTPNLVQRSSQLGLLQHRCANYTF
eukprot:6208125-Pleurochrysis_carterae.AAC.4